MAAVECVKAANCEAYEAANADDAIAVLAAHPEIEILFTDIDMPGSMDGLRLAAVAKSRKPELQIIVVSGHHVPEDLPDNAEFFPKPYSHSDITAAIKRAT